MSAVHFDIQFQPEDKIVVTTAALGLRPYINTEIEMDDDDNVTFTIRAGGGVEADVEQLATFFEGLAEYLREASVDGPE